MKYAYKTIPGELEKFFDGILEICDHDLYNDDMDNPNKFFSLCRKGKDKNKVYNVHIQDKTDMIMLLDYLSYHQASWDYTPKLCIHIDGRVIDFQRRGNHGHINQLENGDMLIIDERVRALINDEFSGNKEPHGDANLRKALNSMVDANETADNTVKRMEREISLLKTQIMQLKSIKDPDLPF